jgi:outer membrane protein OmpA-like peptidoglycan-associated protein
VRAALLSACACLALAPTGSGAMTLDLPAGAALAAQGEEPFASTAIPVGPYEDGRLPAIAAEGAVTRQAWQFPRGRLNTLQILEPLRRQLTAEGFEVLFECAAEACGGFDFRFAAETLPEPAMHVDLGDYRFLSARRDRNGHTEYVDLIVSRSDGRGFVQVTRVGPPEAKGAAVAPPEADGAAAAEPEAPASIGDLAQILARDGRSVLPDLEFETGSARLGAGPFASLEAVAAYLRENPARSVVLVGHTDAEGALDSNIALSKRRAESVRDYLVGRLGVPADQVAAEGVGYLAPVASNRTEAGRMRNRRVEVVATGLD